mmetsp:Transcript_14239/g.34103  ORF Transcript_14239/g.34103 Transcript_14239/m.34103 type:complete len:226 (-) Transcript_14239:35-712(-)
MNCVGYPLVLCCHCWPRRRPRSLAGPKRTNPPMLPTCPLLSVPPAAFAPVAIVRQMMAVFDPISAHYCCVLMRRDRRRFLQPRAFEWMTTMSQLRPQSPARTMIRRSNIDHRHRHPWWEVVHLPPKMCRRFARRRMLLSGVRWEDSTTATFALFALPDPSHHETTWLDSSVSPAQSIVEYFRRRRFYKPLCFPDLVPSRECLARAGQVGRAPISTSSWSSVVLLA